MTVEAVRGCGKGLCPFHSSTKSFKLSCWLNS